MFEIIGILLTSFFMNGCQTSDEDHDVATDDAADVAAFLLVMALMKWGKKEKEKEKEWKLTTIDDPGDVGQFSSLAIDSNNKLHVTYFDATNEDLKYATYDTTASSWSPPITAGGGVGVGQYSSLAIDSNDKLHVTYFDIFNGNLMCATYNTVGWGAGKEVDSSGYVGRYSSLAIDSNDKLHVTYFDATNGNLMYATYDTTTASSWIRTTVDSSGSFVGQFSSLAIDSNDKLHVTYYGPYNGDLMYGTYDTTASSWNPITVDSALTTGPGEYSSLAIDSTDKLHVTYFDATNGHLKYATYDDNSSSWIPITVDSALDAIVGEYSSLAIDSKDNLYVTYYDAANVTFKYAVFS